MSKENWHDLRKDKIRKILDQEGIPTSNEQTKDELIRLLELAKTVSTPSRKSRKYKRKFKLKFKFRPFTLVLLAFLILSFLSSYYLYSNNDVFHKNINAIFKIQEKSKIVGQNTNEPLIYERSGKTYVVYNHPLVKVSAITDQRCLRPECLFDSHLDKVKNSITPLINLEQHDYQTRYAKNMILEYDVKLLPVFIFDRTIEQTLNFEKIKKFFDFKNGKYILNTDKSYKSLVNPKLSDAVFLDSNQFSIKPLEIIIYGNLNSPFFKKHLNSVQQLIEKYPNRQTVAFKYFGEKENDFNTAVALACFEKMEVDPLEVAFKIMDDQEGLLADTKSQLERRFTQIASGYRIDRRSFINCYNDDTTVRQAITNHQLEAALLGITAAPTSLINRNIVRGAFEFADLELLINDIIKTENIIIEEASEDTESDTNSESDV